MRWVGYAVGFSVVAASLAGAATTAGAAPVRPAVAVAPVPAVIGSIEVPSGAAAMAVSADDTVYVTGYRQDVSAGLMTTIPAGTLGGARSGQVMWQDDSAVLPVNLDLRDDTILVTGWPLYGVANPPATAQRNAFFSVADDTMVGPMVTWAEPIGVAPALSGDGRSLVFPSLGDDTPVVATVGGPVVVDAGVPTTAATVTADDTVFLTGPAAVVMFNLADTPVGSSPPVYGVTSVASPSSCDGWTLDTAVVFLDIAVLDDTVYYLSDCSGVTPPGDSILGALDARTGASTGSLNLGSVLPSRIRAGQGRLLLPLLYGQLALLSPDGSQEVLTAPNGQNFSDAVETSTGLVYASYNLDLSDPSHVAVIDDVSGTSVADIGFRDDSVYVTLSTATGSAWFDEMVDGVSIGGVGARYTRSGDTLQIAAPSMGTCTIVAPLRCQAQVTVNLLGGNALNVGTFTYALPPIPAGPPQQVVGQAGDRLAEVTWSAPTSSGSYPITYYRAEVTPGGATCLVQEVSCTITGLTNGTAYTVRVQALTGAGWGEWSSPSATFTPQPTPVVESITITGSRGEVRGRSGVIVAGTSTGVAGRSLTPMVKFPGETSYTPGEARPVVSASGSFTWERRTGKKVYVYFMASDDVRSNRVTIPAK